MEIAKPLQCWIKTRFRCVSKFHLKVKHFCTARSSKHWRSFSSNAFPPVQILFHKHLKLYKVRKDLFLLSSLIYPRNLEMARYSKTAPQWESVKYGWVEKQNIKSLWVQLSNPLSAINYSFWSTFLACLHCALLSTDQFPVIATQEMLSSNLCGMKSVNCPADAKKKYSGQYSGTSL